jgi:hypothetical protein
MIKEVDRLRGNLETKLKGSMPEESKKKAVLDFLEEMKKAGGTILNTLLSKNALSKIDEDNPEYLTFEIDRDRLAIPFEILHDGKDFLCLERAVSRWIVEGVGSVEYEDKAKPRPRLRTASEPISILIIDSRVEADTIPNACSFVDELEQYLTTDKVFASQSVKVESLRGSLSREEVLSKLSSGKYDIVHLVAPAEVSSGDPTASSWILNDGEVRGYELGKLLANGYPQLFISYVSPPPWERKWDGKQQDRILSTLAYSIILAGPSCFIGAVADGLTSSVVTLTKSLYSEILSNKKAFGMALREARLQLIKDKGREDDNWMKLIMYGKPNNPIS